MRTQLIEILNKTPGVSHETSLGSAPSELEWASPASQGLHRAHFTLSMLLEGENSS